MLGKFLLILFLFQKALGSNNDGSFTQVHGKRDLQTITSSPTASPTGQPVNSPVITDSPMTSSNSPVITDSPMTSSNSPVITDSPMTSSPVSYMPTSSPVSSLPTVSPTESPTGSPVTEAPSQAPSESPTNTPTTSQPTDAPTKKPTTSRPSMNPTTSKPSESPTTFPTGSPTRYPTTLFPTKTPTTSSPTHSPTLSPTPQPSQAPTVKGFTYYPSTAPTVWGCYIYNNLGSCISNGCTWKWSYCASKNSPGFAPTRAVSNRHRHQKKKHHRGHHRSRHHARAHHRSKRLAHFREFRRKHSRGLEQDSKQQDHQSSLFSGTEWAQSHSCGIGSFILFSCFGLFLVFLARRGCTCKSKANEILDPSEDLSKPLQYIDEAELEETSIVHNRSFQTSPSKCSFSSPSLKSTTKTPLFSPNGNSPLQTTFTPRSSVHSPGITPLKSEIPRSPLAKVSLQTQFDTT